MLRNVGLRKSVEQPVLDLNFAASQIGSNGAPDARIDFSRGSNAYFVDSDGLVKKSPHNLITNSDNVLARFSNQNSTETNDQTISPDGTLNGDLLVPDTSNASHTSFISTLSISASTSYAYSMFVKANGYNFVQLTFTGGFGNNDVWANFNLSTGATGSKGSAATCYIEEYGNGWFRCVVIGTTGASATTGGPAFAALGSDTASRDPSFAGDGTSGIFVWGAQLSEHTTLPVDNPYIATSSSSAVYAARLDHDPTWFMSAAQEQNLLLYSEVLTDATYWSATRITGVSNTTDTTAPDGTNTAERFLENAVTNTHFFQNDLDESPFITEGKSYTYSAYVKRVAGSNDRNINIELFTTNQAFSPYSVASFDLDAVSSTASTGSPDGHSITDEGNGWFRISITEVANKTTRPAIALVFTEGTTRIYAGDTSKGFYVWGIQLEVGTNPGTYYRTEGAPYYGPGATPKGLLIEEARTNVAPNSHEFTANAGVSRSGELIFAPNAVNEGDAFTISSGSSEAHQIGMNGLVGSAVTVGTVHTVSFFAKLLNGTPNLGVRGFGKGGFNQHPIFNLSNGTVANVGSSWESGTKIEDFGNGWFRCSCVVNPSAQFAPIIHMLESGDNQGVLTYTGNGTDKIALWGGQLEVGSFVTSHIPTSGGTATRNADVATMGPTVAPLKTTGPEIIVNGTFDTDSNWIDDDQGTGSSSISNGKLVLSGSSFDNRAMRYQQVTLVDGERYRLSFDKFDDQMVLRVGTSLQGDELVSASFSSATSGGENFNYDFTANGTTAYVRFIHQNTGSSPSGTSRIDNVSLKKIQAGTELVTNGTFDTDSDWTFSEASTTSITGGKLVFASATSGKAARQDDNTKFVVGRRYRASFDVLSRSSGGVKFKYLEGSGFTLIAQSDFGNAVGTYTVDFTCSNASVNRVAIQTTGTSNTLEVDNVSIRELYPFEAYNPSEGTLVCEFERFGTGSFDRVWELTDNRSGNINQNLMGLLTLNSTSVYFVHFKGGVSSGLDFQSIGVSQGEKNITAYAYQHNNFHISSATNGVLEVSFEDTSCEVPPVDILAIGNPTPLSSNFSNSHIKRLTYFPYRLANDVCDSKVLS